MPWLKILIGVIVAALLLAVALHFISDAGPLNPVKNAIDSLVNVQKKAPGEALSFQAASNTAATNSRLLFNLTTNQSVDGVRLEDAEGNEIACTATLVNGANETNKIWNINAIFDVPYSGDVFAVIREGETWTRTDKSVPLVIVNPTPVPTETPLPTQVPLVSQPTVAPIVESITAAPQPTVETASQEGLVPAITWAPTNAPLPTEAPTGEPTQAPTLPPTEAPTAAPTAAPTPTAVPAPTTAPTATPLPRLDASAGSGSLKTTDTVYQVGSKSAKSITFSRDVSYVAPHPDNYSFYPAGVLTFRGDNFRRNAAYGTANVTKQQLSILWQTPIGYLRTEDNGTLYGVGWTGQPAIVKWTTQVREGMNLYDDKKATPRLREVIFGAQDGKIYFLDLTDGSATRDPITVGYPLKGSVSVDSMDRPLLAVGQGISKLPNKTGSIGLHLYNLIDGKEAFFLNGRKSDTQIQYNTNGAFDGTALFLNNNWDTDAMVVAGENGLLYTVDLNAEFIYPKANDQDVKLSMSIKPSVVYLRTKAGAEKEAGVGVESSVAMYDKYIYMADTYGVIRCVNSDTMKTVWAMDGGDNIDASIALDMDGDSGVSLYTGNTAYSRLGSKNDVTIRRMNALTGETIWTYGIKCDYDKGQLSGCKASPVIGQHSISDLVIFTVNKVKDGGSKVIALSKQTGSLVWERALTSEAVSSPVAVYNDNGDAWIIQGDQGGNLTMMDGRTGAVRNTLNLGGAIEGSPAVYKNYLVVGTCSKDNAYMYGIRIE
ncbi:MAG: PQQ-binding-like beta-propeller repeat protein [Clostridia bacterium]|nr:PQQ-binding-like beta-propeller repeat protein [Clostridia bacterium]